VVSISAKTHLAIGLAFTAIERNYMDFILLMKDFFPAELSLYAGSRFFMNISANLKLVATRFEETLKNIYVLPIYVPLLPC
jgi:hypothetical protein